MQKHNGQVAQGPVGYITRIVSDVLGRFGDVWKGNGRIRLDSGNVSVDTISVGLVAESEESLPEKFSAAVATAVLDGCDAGLVAAGRSRLDTKVYTFSPTGYFNPGCGGDITEYYGAYGLSRSLWHLDPFSLRCADGTVLTGRNCLLGDGHVHVGSIGAMLAACHPGGHCCLAYTLDGYFSTRVPHCIRTLRALQSWVKTVKPSVVQEARRVGVLTLSVGAAEQMHLCPLPGCYTTGQYVKWYAGISVRMVVCDVKVLLKADASQFGAGRFDANYQTAAPLCCVSCPSLGTKILCDACGFVVKAAGHEGRCCPHPIAANALGVLHRRAQIGDAVHRLDVLTVLMARQVSESTRTTTLNLHISAAAQSRYMRSRGYEHKSDRVLSTHFEAMYDTFRVSYLREMFSVSPAFGFPAYNDIRLGVDTALDARNVSGPIDAQYTTVWRELDGGSRAAYAMPHAAASLV